MLKRLIAALVTVMLSAGLVATSVAAPAIASETCDGAGYIKPDSGPDSLDKGHGDVDFEWGNLTWSGKKLDYTIKPGWTVDLCLKASTEIFREDDRAGTGSITLKDHDISHLGYKDPVYIDSRVTCSAATLVVKRPLQDGDHINMTLSQGGSAFQVNAKIENRQAQDPPSETGLVVRFTVPGQGERAFAITAAQQASGQYVFGYSEYLTGGWTVRWVQFNDTYFNQAHKSYNYFACAGTSSLTITTAPSATPPTCDADGKLVVPSIAHVTWSGGANNDGPGTYTLVATADTGYTITGQFTWTVTVLAQGTGADCESVAYVPPVVTPQSCDTDLGGTKQGTLAFTLDPGLAYFLDGVAVTSATPIPAAPGPHTVKVVPAAGHYLTSGVDTFVVQVPAAVGCDGLSTIPLDPFTDPETCDPFSTDGDPANGSITVIHIAGVQFSIGTLADGTDKVAAGTPATTGNVVYPKAAGDYYVFAASADPSITLKPGHDFWPLTVGSPTPACLPTAGLLVAEAMATGAECTAFGPGQGAIVIEPTPGVSYAFKGGPAITATSTNVASGTYTIVATADDGMSTLNADEWVLTVAATAAVCDLTTLALTGQTPIGLVALSLLLLQAGLVFLGIRLARAPLAPRRFAE